jgi:hypothetical protein
MALVTSSSWRVPTAASCTCRIVSADGKVFFINDFGLMRTLKPVKKYDLLAATAAR